MAKKPTPDQIKEQIAALQEIKPKVRRFSSFNDDHWAAIQAQIDVLSVGMSEDDIFEKKDSEEWTESVTENALEARRWLDGETLEDYSDIVASWQELVTK